MKILLYNNLNKIINFILIIYLMWELLLFANDIYIIIKKFLFDKNNIFLIIYFLKIYFFFSFFFYIINK